MDPNIASGVLDKVAAKIAESGAQNSPASSTANPTDAARFADLMANKADAPTDVVAPANAIADGSQGSLGDAILRGLGGVGADLQDKRTFLDGVASKGQVSVADLLLYQDVSIRWGLGVQLIAGGFAKSVQNLNQLTKLQ